MAYGGKPSCPGNEKTIFLRWIRSQSASRLSVWPSLILLRLGPYCRVSQQVVRATVAHGNPGETDKIWLVGVRRTSESSDLTSEK